MGALLVALGTVTALTGCGALGGGGGTKSASAVFERTVGLYEQSDVRILGVKVGQVTKIEPRGDGVLVEFEYDDKYKIPADASALVVAPSIVSDRYVQLTPAYTGGEVLADGTLIEQEDTEVPLELDEVYASLNDLNVALGPNGANKDGALQDLLSVSADNLEGNGELLGSTLEDFSQAVSTLSDQRDDLFGTVNNLQDFTTTIANSDDVVRQFNRDLAVVSDQLAGERQDLARSIERLSVALGEVSTFVADNRESLTTNVTGLADATGALVDQQEALAEFLDTAPTALSNLQLAYNPSTGTLDTRDNGPAQAEGSPLLVLCPLLREGGNRVQEQLGTLLPPDLTGVVDNLANECERVATGGDGGGGGGGLPALPIPLPPLPGGGAAVAPAPPPSDASLSALLMGTR
jgi:phospholipid/cholesterol/gamma-HCH transport system substrate-binding protein